MSEPTGRLVVVRELGTVTIVRSQPRRVVIGTPGPQGPKGDPGLVSGQPRFTGQGPPPEFIAGAQPGDEYLDHVSGNIYRLT